MCILWFLYIGYMELKIHISLPFFLSIHIGYGCADPNYPGVYSRVSENYNWIMENQFTPAPTISESPTSAPTTCLNDNISVHVKTDVYPLETSWVLSKDGDVLRQVELFEYNMENTLYTHDVCIEDLSSSCIEFIIMDYYGDGICCSYGNGYYEVYHGNEVLMNGAEFGSLESDTYCGPDAPPPSPDTECSDQGAVLVTINVQTDEYPTETAWVLKNDDENDLLLQVQEEEYVFPNFLYSHSKCVPYGKCISFEITDSYGDGICCTVGQGYFEVLEGARVVMEGGEFIYVKSDSHCVSSAPDPDEDDAPSPTVPTYSPSPECFGSVTSLFGLIRKNIG